MNIIRDLFKNSKLVGSLAVNDFKTKYAGSQFGIVWAFVQPIVTIMIYVFVFQVIAKANPLENGFPFVLWLIAGMVPWFYFSEAIMNGTTSLKEYSYLVKKVVFQIDVLPAVRVISSIFVHLFFVVFTIIIYILSGEMPTIYATQLIYYMLCNVVLAMSFSYITSAIMPFFTDFSQVVNIILMISMWVCPVMWDYRTIMPQQYQWILRCNPVFYVIQGYRDALVDQIWFWERPLAFVCFWTTTFVVFGVGVHIFKKLSIHFSDVL